MPKLDRNARIKIIVAVDRLRHQSRTKGRQGVVTVHMVEVLRVLLLRLYDAKTGTAWPSFDTLADLAGVARRTVARAIAALESLGVLVIERRYHRWFHAGRSLIVRTSNRYGFASPKCQMDTVHRQARLKTKNNRTKAGAIEQAQRWLNKITADIADREAEAVAWITANRAVIT